MSRHSTFVIITPDFQQIYAQSLKLFLPTSKIVGYKAKTLDGTTVAWGKTRPEAIMKAFAMIDKLAKQAKQDALDAEIAKLDAEIAALETVLDIATEAEQTRKPRKLIATCICGKDHKEYNDEYNPYNPDDEFDAIIDSLFR